MSSRLEYHKAVRHPISATVALLAAAAFFFAFTPHSQAQINGTPASVTSPGFGGHAVNGPPASVTSVGPRGYAPGDAVRFSGGNFPHHNGDGHNGDGHVHHHRFNDYGPGIVYAPIPYAIDPGAAQQYQDNNDEGAADDDADYQGGPTIFDRRGRGADSYVPPVKYARPSHPMSEPPADAQQQDEQDPPQEPTTLVFKDGHKLDVGNYAIVGSTLFDLTPGHSRKVPLAELDVPATQKINDDRGIIFRLPIGTQGS